MYEREVGNGRGKAILPAFLFLVPIKVGFVVEALAVRFVGSV